MNDLEKLIADSIASRGAKIAEAEAEEKAAEARREALFNAAVKEGIERVIPLIPPPLHPYIKFNGAQPANYNMPAAWEWRPATLDIDAPGLAQITINPGTDDDDRPIIWSISVEGSTLTFGGDQWEEAIAAAFDCYHERRREYSEAARSLG